MSRPRNFLHDGEVVCCAMSEGLIATGDAAKKLIVRDLETGSNPHTFEHDGVVLCCAISGGMIAAGDAAKKLIVRDLETGNIRHTFEHAGGVLCCAMLGDLLAAGDEANNLIVRSLSTGDVRHTFKHDSDVSCCAMLGGLLAAGDEANNLIVRSLSTGDVRHAFKHAGDVSCCAMLGNLLAAGDGANKLIVRDLETGNVRHTFEHDGDVYCCAMSSGLIAAGAGASDGTNKLTVRDLKTGKAVHCFEHDGKVDCCAMSGDLLAAGDLGNHYVNKLIVRDLFALSSLDGLVPGGMAGAIRRRPELLHRRIGPATGTTTLLHYLASLPEQRQTAACLEVVLNAIAMHNDSRRIAGEQPFQLMLTVDHAGETPLEVAVNASHLAKAKVLAAAYVRAARHGAWRATGIAWAGTLKVLSLRNPALLSTVLGSACFSGPPQRFRPGSRLPLKELPAFRPHASFHGVDWCADDRFRSRLDPEVGAAHQVTAGWGEVAAKVAGMGGLMAVGGPFNAIAHSRDLKAFETKAMVWAVEFKWAAYGNRIHRAQMFVFLAGVALFFAAQTIVTLERHGARMLGELAEEQTASTSFQVGTASGLMIGSAVTSGALLLGEVAQMAVQLSADGAVAGLVRHFGNVWDWLEMLCYALMLTSAVTFVAAGDGSTEWDGTTPRPNMPVNVAALCGCSNILATFNLLSFLRPYKRFGPLIQMVVQIMKDIEGFLVVMLICLVGFTMAFATMLPNQPRFQQPMALLTLFEMMLGAWDLEQFDGESQSGGADPLTTLAAIAFVLYTVMVLVVAMNLLIAIMGDTYNRVRENQEVHGRIQRAETLVQMEWLARRLFSEEECFPQFLHVLAPAEDDDDDGSVDNEWGGTLKRLPTGTLKQLRTEVHTSNAEIKAAMVTNAELDAARHYAVKSGMVSKAEFDAVKSRLTEMHCLLQQLVGNMAAGSDAAIAADAADAATTGTSQLVGNMAAAFHAAVATTEAPIGAPAGSGETTRAAGGRSTGARLPPPGYAPPPDD